MTQKIKGELEIDNERGVIYFHGEDGVTKLRIGKLPTPIMRIDKSNQCLDIAHMHGCSWKLEVVGGSNE